MISKDTATTALGAAMGIMTAIQPTVAAVDGSFKQADWIKLATALMMAVFGYFTNRGSTSDQK